MDLSHLRKEYRLRTLDLPNLDKNPLIQFDLWFQETLKVKSAEPSAMQLATVGKNGKPSCRTVLLKAFDESGFRFFTNYDSRKGKEIAENPNVCLLFFWKDLERQVIIEGKARKTSREISQEYFDDRSRNSRISSAVSKQSRHLESRQFFDIECEKFAKRYQDQPIPCPSFWGGYNVVPVRYEFWQGRENRMHDRFEYKKSRSSGWKIQRLWP